MKRKPSIKKPVRKLKDRKIPTTVYVNLWIPRKQHKAIVEHMKTIQESNPTYNKSDAIRNLIHAGLRNLKLIALLFLAMPSFAHAQEPLIDFSDPQNQINSLAAFAFATTTYGILRKNGVRPFPAWLISHGGAAAASVAYDMWGDDSKGLVSQSRQGTTATVLMLSTVISISIFDK